MGSQLAPKRGTAPVLGSCLLWPNGWMDEDTTWYRSRRRPRPHCIRLLDGVRALRERGTAAPPLFSANVYCGHGPHLSYCWALVTLHYKDQFTRPWGRNLGDLKSKLRSVWLRRRTVKCRQLAGGNRRVHRWEITHDVSLEFRGNKVRINTICWTAGRAV